LDEFLNLFGNAMRIAEIGLAQSLQPDGGEESRDWGRAIVSAVLPRST